MEYLIERLKEPSTWAGFSVLLQMLGITVGEQELALIGGGISAALAVILRERAKP